MTAETITQFAVHLGLVVLGVSFLLTVWRVIKGPTLPDRVIALDMLVGIVMGFIALIAIRTGFTLYIDIAISLGLVGFLATVAFARFILSRQRREGEDGSPPAAVAPPATVPSRTRRKDKPAPAASAPPLSGVPGPAAAARPAKAEVTKAEATKASAAKVKIAKAREAGRAKAAAPQEPAKGTAPAKTVKRKPAAKADRKEEP